MMSKQLEQPFEREAVRRFAEQMEINLRKHDDRPGWNNGACDPYWLLNRARDELDELEAAMRNPVGRVAHVVEEAADVGNFCMMIAEVVSEEGEKKALEIIKDMKLPE